MKFLQLLKPNTVLATQMCTLLYLPPFFFPLFLSSNDRKQKSVVDKNKTQKIQKGSLAHFFNFFWANKMGTLNLIRAFMYWEKSVPLKEEKRGRDKKRDKDAERARDGLKRHANYGPSLPESIPTLGESRAQIYVAQIAQIKGIYYGGFRLCLEACAAEQGGHIKK